MDSSKISEECSSSESGWTTYIASPDIEHDYAENDEDDDVDEDANIRQKGYKKRAQIEEEAADSDDSMASDASSGPSGQRCSYGYLGTGRNNGFSHAGSNNGRDSVAKKLNQKEEKKKQTKGEKDKSGNKANSGGRLKKL